MCKLQFFFFQTTWTSLSTKLMSTKLISTKLTLRLSPSQCAYWYKLDISDIKNYLWLLWLILQIPKECLSLFFPLWAEINGTTKRHEHTATCAAARPGGEEGAREGGGETCGSSSVYMCLWEWRCVFRGTVCVCQCFHKYPASDCTFMIGLL